MRLSRNNAADLRKRVEELEETRMLAESLSQVQTVNETLLQVASWCARLCNADFATILLLRHGVEDSVLTVVRAEHHGSEAGIEHGLNTLIAGHVRVHGKPFRADDVIRDMNLHAPSDRQRQYGASLAVPLTVGTETIGVLSMVNKRGGHSFTDEALHLAESTAPLISRFITRARLQERLSFDRALLLASAPGSRPRHWIPSVAPSMRIPMEQLAKVAPTNASVLVSGETGTGKELFARAIHLQSLRAEGPFVALSCAAIPSTLFESELFGHEKGAFTGADARRAGDFEVADGGTLFLDEISSLPHEMQPKLLRVLEEKRYRRVGSSAELSSDFRLVAATNRDLGEMVAKGEFREDLYHRVNVIPIRLPPLRERLEDIPVFASEFLAQFSGGKQQLTHEALTALAAREWHGNIRELRNYIERLSILCLGTEITADDVTTLSSPVSERSDAGLRDAYRALVNNQSQSGRLLETSERQLIVAALEATSGNVSVASRLLGTSRSSLQRKIKEYEISYP